ncbi:NAD-binding protein [Streptomyces sp. NPDC023588]|uniref:NAD-binding protein n=1 Tax=Streptomyces sp. NPDC023588 TaxID=3154907 RepID=UPI0033FF5280
MADAVPGRLVLIGGGAVACEVAAAWRTLGSSVTLLVRDQALLSGWQPCAREEVTGGGRARRQVPRLHPR